MTNEVSLFSTPLPAHVHNTKSAAMQAMAGGLAGGGFGNRISLRNSKFRFVQNGVDVGVHDQTYLDVIIFALANSVQRLYYENPYEANTKARPDCWSHDGKTPAEDVPKKQSAQCGICPQNVKGSGRLGNTKACAYKKRVVVLAPDDIEGPAYALDVSGQSMFGEQEESQNRFSFKGYFEKLSAHDVSIDAIVTRLVFDDKASVPKLHFTPIRALTQDEYAVVQTRNDDPDVQKMLKDLTNEVEVEAFESAPVQQAVPKQVTAQGKVVTPTSQVQAPQPQQPQAAVKKGFGGKAAETPAPVTPAVKPKTMTIDLESLTNFDN